VILGRLREEKRQQKDKWRKLRHKGEKKNKERRIHDEVVKVV